MRRLLLGVGVLCMLLAGYVSGEGQFQWRYYQHYSAAQKNRQALAKPASRHVSGGSPHRDGRT